MEEMNENIKNDEDPLVIMQLLPHFDGGSVVREVLDTSIYIKERGLTPIVVSGGGKLTRFLHREGIKHIEMDFSSNHFWALNSNSKKISALVEEYKVSLIHAHSRASAWAAYKSGLKTPCHLVTSAHRDYDVGFWGGQLNYNSILTKGERVIAVSTYIADYLKQNYPFDHSKLKIVPKWVDIKSFDPSQVGAERIINLSSIWRLPDGVKIVMMAGDLIAEKGHLLLMQALEKMDQEHLLCLIIAKDIDGGYLSKLRRYIKKHNLTEIVHIIEGCSDMPAAYMLADVIVSPSIRPEAFGTAILEAQAMGRPVVASNFGSSLEIIKPGITGEFFEAGNADDLAEKLTQTLALNLEQRKELAAKSIVNARVKFSDMSMCERIFDTYLEVLG